MTIQEMKNLKLGDVVEDLQMLKNVNRVIYCVVIQVEYDRVICIALDKKDEGHYPHSFRFNEYDCIKLDMPVKNITQELFKYIQKSRYRSFESFKNKAIK